MDTINQCPLCKNEKIEIRSETKWYGYYVICPCCGDFEISGNCTADKDTLNKIDSVGYILSGVARELKELGEKPPRFVTENIDDYLKHYLVPDLSNIEAKANKLLIRLKEKSTYFGKTLKPSFNHDYSLAYAHNSEEFRALIFFLKESGLINIGSVLTLDDTPYSISLTASAWNLNQHNSKASNNAFIAAWFDDVMDSSINAIKNAIQESDYIPTCLWGDHFSEKIIDKALGEIRNSRFVVVDLTNGRASVFYEAGFAQALGIDTIYVYNKEVNADKSPLDFYTKHYQCYSYNNAAELKEIVMDVIKARIK
ncbi:MAG: hypothetical protein HYV33_03190 [Candidatus Kerfeldbacteria bacterium]|nr:hypothetical protein [Candidatus Kerfeldbacteria bacterium]